MFFASVEDFVDAFDYSIDENKVMIDFSKAHVWDDSAVGAIDKVVLKYKENNIDVSLKGLNASQ